MPHRVRQKWVSIEVIGSRRVAISCLKRTHVGANDEGEVYVGSVGWKLGRDPWDQLPSVGHATPCMLEQTAYVERGRRAEHEATDV
jgi:hypothetical protein